MSAQLVAFSQSQLPQADVTINLRYVPLRSLNTVDLAREKDALRRRLQRHGLDACIGNLEISFSVEHEAWKLHAHLLVFGFDDTEIPASLKTGKIAREICPLKVKNPVEQITYLFKFITYYRRRRGGKAFPMRLDHLLELANWRCDQRFLDSLVLVGFQRRGFIVPGEPFRRLLARPTT